MSLTARDVQAHLESLADGWEYPPDTVDTFKVGSPETVVTGVAVAWMPYSWALEKAWQLDCSLFVTHEPTFYDHRDDRQELFELAIPAERRRRIESWGMAVLRCHDLWDRHPTLGITDSWAAALDLHRLIDRTEFARLYEVEEVPAAEFASKVADRSAHYGQPGVQLVGNPDRVVRRVCVGTGAISPYLDLVARFDPDVVVCSDDGMDYWRDGAFAVDGGPPIVVVHHGVTEEPGVANLAEVLRVAFPQVPVHHIAQTCMYHIIPASTEADADQEAGTTVRSPETQEKENE